MDLRGRFLKLDAPNPPIPSRELLKDHEEYFQGVEVLLAPDAGITLISEPADIPHHERRQDTQRRLMARVFFFLFNNTTDKKSAQALINMEIEEGSLKWDRAMREIKNWQNHMQQELMGCGSTGLDNNKKFFWLPKFVQSTILNYNFKVHLYNMRIEILRYEVPEPISTPAECTARAAKLQDLKAIFYEHKQEYLQKIRQTIALARTTDVRDIHRPNWNTPSYLKFLNDQLRLVEDMQLFETVRSLDSSMTYNLYYHELSEAEQTRFWAKKWTKDRAVSFYFQFRKVLDIGKMYDNPHGVSQWMRKTFITAAMNVWEFVLKPKIIDREVNLASPSTFIHFGPQDTRADKAYASIRKIRLPASMVAPQLAQVLVAKDGYSHKRLAEEEPSSQKRQAVDRTEDEMEVEESC